MRDDREFKDYKVGDTKYLDYGPCSFPTKLIQYLPNEKAFRAIDPWGKTYRIYEDETIDEEWERSNGNGT